MGTLKSPNRSPDRRKLINKVLGGLVNQIEMQQQQIFSLAKNMKLKNEHHVMQVNLFKERISQMTKDFRLLQMQRTVDAAKSDMLMGMKYREAFQYKLKLDRMEGELADFKEGFEILSHKCSDPKDTPNSVNNNGEEHNISRELERKVQKLKYENEKLSSKNSALSSERDFVWNQFKKIESNLTDQLKTKNTEIEQANEKIRNLLGDMEKLQSSNDNKGEKITALRTKIAKLEDESVKKNEEISRLTKETELLRKSKSDYNTPVLRRCTVEQRMSRLGGKNSGSVTVKKEIHSSQVNEKESRNSKRKASEINNSPSTSEVPKLFTSTFKVPKLKTSSRSSSPSAI